MSASGISWGVSSAASLARGKAAAPATVFGHDGGDVDELAKGSDVVLGFRTSSASGVVTWGEKMRSTVSAVGIHRRQRDDAGWVTRAVPALDRPGIAVDGADAAGERSFRQR